MIFSSIKVLQGAGSLCGRNPEEVFFAVWLGIPEISMKAQMQYGGLGINMTKQLMDDVGYAYQDRQNILTMGRYLSSN